MSIKIGKIMDIEIKLHYTWLIIFFFITWSIALGYARLQYLNLPSIFYWIIGVATAFIVFLSVLIHELFHSLIAKRKGLPVPRITLFIFGGVAEIAEEPKNPIVEFKMAAAGPLSSLMIAMVFALGWIASRFLNLSPLIKAPLQYGFTINLMLALFNLIPAFPMDGGRIFRAIVWKRTNDVVKATRTSALVAEGFSYMFMVFGFIWLFFGALMNGLWLIFIGWFLKSGAEASLRQTIISQALAKVKIKDIMSSPVCTINPNNSLMEAVENCFYKYKHGGFPVVENNELKGMLTLEDLRKVPKEAWGETLVKQAMTSAEKLLTIKPEDPALEALIKMSSFKIGRLPVIDEGKLIGIVTRSDVIHAIRTRLEIGEVK
ncbi:site-2 protease family protein [Candidatus Bathyarchaeota archaeon]|nr:site-2 protease family protein [Candidatus Bathyarchaeota archaeon]